MAQLRNFQLFRNENAFTHASHEVGIAAFKQSSAWANMQDGEILLYSYTITGEENSPVHSLIGVVRNGKLDIITNEGTLREVVKNSIDVLDSKVSTWEYDANGDRIANTKSVNVEIIQTDGKLTGLTVDYSNLTNVLDSLDFTHTTTNTDNTTFKIFGTNQANGLISEVNDGTITFDRALTDTNKAATTGYVTDAINALDVANVDVATLTDGVVEIYNVTEVDGKIAQNNKVATLAKVATTGAAADVSITTIEGMTATNVQDALEELRGQTITAEADQAVQVTTDAEGNTTVGLQLANGEQVLSQTANGLKTTIALSYEPTTTTIKLTGIDGANLGEIDATNFVKDGILQDVVIVEGEGVAEEGQTQVLEEGHRYFRFTYKTVYYDENNETVDSTQVVYLDVESLVDTYTAGNAWIEIEPNANTISHKIQEGLGITGEATTVTTATAPNSDATAAGIATITVPELTIDKAGHITKQENKTYEINLPVTAVVQVEGQTVVTSAVAEGGNDTTYTVGLAEVNPVNTQHTDDYALLNNTTSNEGATHTRVESITVDEFGRVTGYTLTTVQENFDMGMYN